MNFGGPVWHASAATPYFNLMQRKLLWRVAKSALRNVGDAQAGEWLEYTGKAFHIRRRLTESEEKLVGPVVDIRGTPEAEERLAIVRHLLPIGYKED